eukprot:TRINITY_DN3600_c0_g1_i1.p1 TRINITY_DN3600_c0_g1~~TRINITY_DN3600_c0_g1_i1.p1  ORF type:complete len:370 (-),score=70.33 TRINITY_DN3600_c0_g1_i1:161-1270(-)
MSSSITAPSSNISQGPSLQQEFSLRQPPTDGISNVEFSPRDPFLLVSSWDSTVRLYDAVQNSLNVTWNHSSAVLDCCFSDVFTVYSGGLGMSLRMFDLNTQQETVLGEHKKAIKCVEYSKEETLAVTGSWDSTIKIWDPRSSIKDVGTHAQPGKVFTMALTGKRIIVGTSSRQVWIWDLRKMDEPEQRRESSLKFQTRCIRPFVEEDGYALSSTEGRVAMEYFDPAPQIQAKKYAFKCHRNKTSTGVEHVYPVNVLAFHPVFGTFASGGDDCIVNIWDGKNKKRLCQFRKYPHSISSLSFSYDGSLLAIASSYTFYEGDRGNTTPENIFVRTVNDIEVRPKARVKSQGSGGGSGSGGGGGPAPTTGPNR